MGNAQQAIDLIEQLPEVEKRKVVDYVLAMDPEGVRYSPREMNKLDQLADEARSGTDAESFPSSTEAISFLKKLSS